MNVELLNLARAREARARIRLMEAEGQNSGLVEQARQSAAAAAKAAEDLRKKVEESQAQTRLHAEALREQQRLANERLRQQRVREVRAAANGSETASAAGSLVSAQQAQFNQSTRLIQETRDRIQVKRPPVQPDTEIAKEQSEIQKIVQQNAMFIQIVLFLVLLCAISYLVLPQTAANVVSLIVLGAALIYRIFFIQ